jgi:hypothetical protein
MMASALLLFVVNGVNYLLLVLNYRAVAQGSITRTAITDGLIAAAGFTLIGHVAAADRNILGHVAYVLGGVVGSIVALLLSRRLERTAEKSETSSAPITGDSWARQDIPPDLRFDNVVAPTTVRFEYGDGRVWETQIRGRR